MKLSFTVLATLVTLSVFVPFLIFILKGLNSTSKTKQKAENLIKSNGFKYALKEVWNNKFMGLTEDKSTLTFIHFNEENNQVLNLNLSEIKSCEIVTDYKKDKDKVTRLKHLDLKVNFHSSKKEALLINFFNTDDGFTEDYELRRVENWHMEINTIINRKVTFKKAS